MFIVLTMFSDFVTSLSEGFPATASTVNRTVGKLGLRSSEVLIPRCPLCSLPADRGTRDWRRAHAITSLGDPTSSSTSQSAQLEELLCYACLVLLQDRRAGSKDGLKMPAYVDSAVNQELDRRKFGNLEFDRLHLEDKDHEYP